MPHADGGGTRWWVVPGVWGVPGHGAYLSATPWYGSGVSQWIVEPLHAEAPVGRVPSPVLPLPCTPPLMDTGTCPDPYHGYTHWDTHWDTDPDTEWKTGKSD